MKKPAFKIGDKVTSFLLHSNMKKIKVVGKIKSIKYTWGKYTYTLTDVKVDDFPTRTVK